MDKETKERVEKPIGHMEYPKMLHHTDGSNVTVNSPDEEKKVLAGGNHHPSPGEALDEKEKRDQADAKKAALKLGEEAKAVADGAGKLDDEKSSGNGKKGK